MITLIIDRVIRNGKLQKLIVFKKNKQFSILIIKVGLLKNHMFNSMTQFCSYEISKSHV